MYLLLENLKSGRFLCENDAIDVMRDTTICANPASAHDMIHYPLEDGTSLVPDDGEPVDPAQCDWLESGSVVFAYAFPGWVADDGNAEVEYPFADSANEAARDYVADGDWGPATKTQFIRVYVWRCVIGFTDAGETVYGSWGRDDHLVSVEPPEPACTGAEHDWRAPVEVVGGIAENPGVQGHGGGVVCVEVCAHCGAYRVTDSWAQDPATGAQGLHSVEYREADETSQAWLETQETGA